MTTEQLAPYDELAEEAVIGAILIDGDLNESNWHAVADWLKPEDFYIQRNRLCYEAALNVFRRGDHVDMGTLAHELGDRLADVGGTPYFGQLYATVPVSTFVYQKAVIVVKLKRKRDLLRIIHTLPEQITTDDSPSDTIHRLAEQLHGIHMPGESLDNSMRGIGDRLLQEWGDEIDIPPYRLQTGIQYLDDLTYGGLKAKQLVIIGADTGIGKTALALQVAHLAAVDGLGVLYLSLEMDGLEMMQRMIASRTGLNVGILNDVYKAETSQTNEMMQAHGAISELPMYIPADAVQTPASIAIQVRRYVQEHDIKLLVVDHLQLVRAESDKDVNRNVELDVLTRVLKGLAMELNITVLALSQFNRSTVRNAVIKPDMSSLRDSHTIAQNADIVVLMHIPEPDDDAWEIPVQVVMAKHRNGKKGTAFTIYDRASQRFRGAAQAAKFPDFRGSA